MEAPKEKEYPYTMPPVFVPFTQNVYDAMEIPTREFIPGRKKSDGPIDDVGDRVIVRKPKKRKSSKT